MVGFFWNCDQEQPFYSVPGPTELLRERNVSPNTASTIKNVSPGRMIDLPEGLKNFVIGENGLESICKLLHPHAVSLFRDLSEMQISQCDMKGLVESGNSMDSEAIVVHCLNNFTCFQ